MQKDFRKAINARHLSPASYSTRLPKAVSLNKFRLGRLFLTSVTLNDTTSAIRLWRYLTRTVRTHGRKNLQYAPNRFSAAQTFHLCMLQLRRNDRICLRDTWRNCSQTILWWLPAENDMKKDSEWSRPHSPLYGCVWTGRVTWGLQYSMPAQQQFHPQ